VSNAQEMNQPKPNNSETPQQPRTPIDLSQIEFRIKNSHCSYFGIYSFNLTKWRSHEPGELHTWCDSAKAKTAYDQHRAEWISKSSLSASNAAERYDKMYHAGSQKLRPGHYRNYLVGYLKVTLLLYDFFCRSLDVLGKINQIIQ